MLEWLSNGLSWFTRVFKILRAAVREHDNVVAPHILVVRKIHYGLLSGGTFDATAMRGHLLRLCSSEDGIWSNADRFACREQFARHARDACGVLEKHGAFRNEIEESEYRMFLDNTKDRLIAALERRRLPKAFDPYETKAPSMFNRIRNLLAIRS